MRIISFLSVLFLFSCADLRTKSSKKTPKPLEARELLTKMGIAHGIDNWKKIDTYSVRFEDEFYGKLGKRATPYPSMFSTFELDYIPNSFDGRMKFLDGPWKGKTWGIQNWKTYTIDGNQSIFEENKNASFWLPTYQYFIEFPLRIQNANALALAGEKEIDSIKCIGIIASWNKIKPQKKIDQYLIWINVETFEIVKIEYTIRDVFSFVTGAARCIDYATYGGIRIPQRMIVTSNLIKDGALHEMRVKSMEFNQVSRKELLPNNDIGTSSDAKL